MTHTPVTKLKRREFLRQGTLGIGSLALSQLINQDVRAEGLHHKPRAKNVIFLHNDTYFAIFPVLLSFCSKLDNA